MESSPILESEGQAIVRVLAVVLERLVSANSHLAQTDQGQVTKFHALRAPAIGISQYLDRIHKYASCSNECFILALIYIDRLIQRNNFLLTELNVHRVIITSVLLAAKFFDDAYYNNAYYAKVGGVLVSEMNSLEVEFLFRINFSLRVMPDVFEKYSAELVAHASAMGLQSPTQNSARLLLQVPDLQSRGLNHHPPLDGPCVESTLQYFPSSGSNSGFQSQVSAPTGVAPQPVPHYQSNLVAQINGLSSQPNMHNLPQITPSPPPPHASIHSSLAASLMINRDEIGCANSNGVSYAPNVAAHQQLNISLASVGLDLQQKLLLASSGVVENPLENQNTTWSALQQAINQNPLLQMADPPSNSTHNSSEHRPSTGTDMAGSIHIQSAPSVTNVQTYANVPFPQLPMTTTPPSTFSTNSSPGLVRLNDSLSHSESCSHSNYGCNEMEKSHLPHNTVMHQNYADYITPNDVGMNWQRRHSDVAVYGGHDFISSSGHDISLQTVAQYVNTSPRVES